MPENFEKPDITMLSTEEVELLMHPVKKPTITSERTQSIEYYKNEIEKCPDGGGFFVSANYSQRVKLRRRITKAAAMANCTVAFKKGNRGGEVVKVYRESVVE